MVSGSLDCILTTLALEREENSESESNFALASE